jgi:hypothetical protein
MIDNTIAKEKKEKTLQLCYLQIVIVQNIEFGKE